MTKLRVIYKSLHVKSIEKVWQLNYVFQDTPGFWRMDACSQLTDTTLRVDVFVLKRCSCSPLSSGLHYCYWEFSRWFSSFFPFRRMSAVWVCGGAAGAVHVCVHPLKSWYWNCCSRKQSVCKLKWHNLDIQLSGLSGNYLWKRLKCLSDSSSATFGSESLVKFAC